MATAQGNPLGEYIGVVLRRVHWGGHPLGNPSEESLGVAIPQGNPFGESFGVAIPQRSPLGESLGENPLGWPSPWAIPEENPVG